MDAARAFPSMLQNLPFVKHRAYQTVWTFETRMRPSRLMTGTPKYTPVAATMRSG